MKEKIVVSVICTTYNHAPYIRKCLEGIFMQKASFAFEVIIHDDASTDKTVDIIHEFELNYPEMIVPIYQKVNLYSQGKAIDIYSLAKGEYIALCEGDDYWTDPYKLQKQVVFLEKNPTYGLVYTYANVFIEKDNIFKAHPFGKSISSIKELLLENSIPTPTVLLKKQIYLNYEKEISPQNRNWLMGDYPLWLYFASVSKINCFNYPSAVYRVLENSAVHSPDFKKELLFQESYQAVKLYYINMLGYGYLDKKIWGRYFSNKAYIYLLRNEKNIAELINEIEENKVRSLKIHILKIIISSRALRKMLKSYWSE